MEFRSGSGWSTKKTIKYESFRVFQQGGSTDCQMIIFARLKPSLAERTFLRMQSKPVSFRTIKLGLILLFVVIYLLPLNLRQLSVPDEMRYGEIPREMLATGDFIVPHANGLRYFEKPVGGYVLNASSMAIFGETNFAVRLPSALATGLGAWVLFLLMRREYGKRTATLGAFIFLTCAEVMGVGTFSVLDSMVAGFITLTLCSLYFALNAAGKKRIGLLALTGAFAGGAFLVKGFIALAVPVVVIVPYLLIRKEWKQLFILPWIPLITALAVSLPWCLAIAAKEPDFWHYFFWEEHIRRFFSTEHAQHKAPFWYFVPVFIGGAFPWVLIAPLPLRDLVRQRLKEPLIQFSLIWLVMPFLFFSVSSGKLGTYILPCFAPFSLLLACALSDRFKKQESNRYLQVGIIILLAVVTVALTALPVIGGLNAFKLLPPLAPRFALKFTVLLIGLSLSLYLLIRALKEENSLRKTIGIGLSTAIIFVTVTAGLPSLISTGLGIQHFLESEQSHVESDTILVGSSKTILSLCYVYKRDDVYVFRNAGELRYGLSFPDSEHRLLDVQKLKNLIHQRGSKRVVLVLKSRPTDPMRAELPKPAYSRQWLKIWFAVYEPRNPEPAKE